MNFRRILSTVALVTFFGLGLVAILNQQQIRDWWVLRSYEPTAEISALAEHAGLSEQGTNYFYISDPQLNDKQSFNTNCPFEERTIVLGCYDGTTIFILDIDEPTLDGVETVTAAHEMLHAAYTRLSDDKKAEVDRLVQEQFERTENQRIRDLVSEYDTNDQALINNELHSILPTELEKLSPELEEYYSDLFDDRQKVVAAAKRYEAVFIELDDKMADLESQLESYKSEIEALETQLANLQLEIDKGRQELEELSQADKIEEYNNKVPGFNVIVREYNLMIAKLQTTVADHNELVAEINDTALRHNELVNTIDSKYQEI